MEDEGGLTGSVRAEQGDAFASGDRQVHPEERLVAVGVGVGEATDFQGRRGGGGHAHTVHPSRQMMRASTGSAEACAHWVLEAVTSSMTGMEPA